MKFGIVQFGRNIFKDLQSLKGGERLTVARLFNGQKMRAKLADLLVKTNGNGEKVKNGNGGKIKNGSNRISYSRSFV